MTKARITRIGIITDDDITRDWSFDGGGSAIAIEMGDGKSHVGGYTLKELREISQLKRELDSLTRGDVPRDLAHICPNCSSNLSFREAGKDYFGRREVWVCTNCLYTWIFTEQPPPEPKRNLLQRLLNRVGRRIV